MAGAVGSPVVTRDMELPVSPRDLLLLRELGFPAFSVAFSPGTEARGAEVHQSSGDELEAPLWEERRRTMAFAEPMSVGGSHYHLAQDRDAIDKMETEELPGAGSEL